MKWIRRGTIIILVFIVIVANKNLLPKSKEIDDMEILKLVGLDYDSKNEKDKAATVSCLINKEIGTIENGNESGTEKQMLMSYSSSTFNSAIRKMQFYTDKILTGSHIQFFLIGENAAKEDIDKVVDQFSKSQEVRLSTHVYLVKDMTSNEFLTQLVGMDTDVSDKLKAMENKSSYKTIVKFLTLSDMLSQKLSEPEIYLIPALSIIQGNEKLEEIKEGDSSEETVRLDKQFDFYGYAIMKQSNLMGYIDEKESSLYNMLINEADGSVINITNTDKEKMSFGINSIKTKYSYDFDKNDKLKKVKIKLTFISNFEETYSREDITKKNNMEKYERLQEQKIKKEVEKFISKTKELNMDILKISDKLKLSHPYKFRKNKDTFKKQYKDIEFEIDVQVKIDTTYDMITTDK